MPSEYELSGSNPGGVTDPNAGAVDPNTAVPNPAGDPSAVDPNMLNDPNVVDPNTMGIPGDAAQP